MTNGHMHSQFWLLKVAFATEKECNIHKTESELWGEKL